MIMQNHQEHINIFHSLFKGREDVFAVRWEKGTTLLLGSSSNRKKAYHSTDVPIIDGIHYGDNL